MAEDENAQGNSPLTPAVFHTLLALGREPMHGYAIMRAAAEDSQGAVRLGPGTVYGSLDRMEDLGLVEELPGEAARRGEDRRRKYYRITGRGRVALEREAGRLTRLAELVRAQRIAPAG